MSTFYVDPENSSLTECANDCGAERRPANELDDVCDFTERIEAGGEVPAGQCPDCGALCYLVKMEGAEEKELLDVVKAVAAAIEKAYAEGKRCPDLVELHTLCRNALAKVEGRDE
jgi:hypothetical protein